MILYTRVTFSWYHSYFSLFLSPLSCSFFSAKTQCEFSANLEFNRLLEVCAAEKNKSKKNDLLSNKNMFQTFSCMQQRNQQQKMLNLRMLLFVREKMVKNFVIDILLSCCKKMHCSFGSALPTIISMPYAHSNNSNNKLAYKISNINSEACTNAHETNKL